MPMRARDLSENACRWIVCTLIVLDLGPFTSALAQTAAATAPATPLPKIGVFDPNLITPPAAAPAAKVPLPTAPPHPIPVSPPAAMQGTPALTIDAIRASVPPATAAPQ